MFLRTLLADGPMCSKEILLRADSMKLNERTLRRAAEALGIAQSRKTIFQNGGGVVVEATGYAERLDRPSVHLTCG